MWLYYIISAVIAAVIYYVTFVPLHYKCGDSGNKKAAINQARRLRKPGTNIPPPYPNGWFALATSDEIKPGTAKSIDCLGENFVVFRSAVTKQVYVLDAYCPHMGANLGVGGIVNGECIKCPFHHWNFDGKDGSLVDIPYSDDLKSVQKFSRIKKWTCREVNKLIFLWYHVENEEPWEIPAISEVENNELWLHGTNEFMIHSHIQDIPENGADLAHLAAVHGPSMFAGTDINTFRESILAIGTHLWDAKWSVSENLKHMTNIKLTHIIQFWLWKFFQVDGDIYQIGPGYVVLKLKAFFGDILVLQTVTPIEPLKQKLSHYFYASGMLGLIMKISIYGETVQVARDAMIWDYKTFVRNPILPKEEKQIKLYRNWFSQFYSANSKSFQDSRNDLTW
ncbi:cholesterol 7-desaturase nvd-like [Chironomus tepperi]|uniref:cholesterol 7-desaturase nvd-like n=1 Tax=Chironomus tepperi TaxID=113505 RepID=UPI00391F3785